MMVWLVYPLTTIVPNYSAFRKRNRRLQGGISQILFSSPGEFPTLRSQEDGFSDLIGLRERNPGKRFHLIVI
jgi:hypothetical protein